MLEREINTEIMYNHWISYKTEIMKLNENKRNKRMVLRLSCFNFVIAGFG